MGYRSRFSNGDLLAHLSLCASYFEAQGPASDDLLAAASESAQAGYNYLVFLKNGKTYKFAGEILLHELGFEVLKSKHNGVHDILTYVREGADRGDLVI